MTHETQTRTVPNSETAVLLVHGILGTPHQFDPLLPAIPDTFTTVNLLLDGHGGSVDNFSRSSMQKWETQVADLVEKLCRHHQNVFILAHSMGTLFAIDAALRHPDKVKGIFLLSPPLRIGLKPRMFANALKVGLGFAKPDDAGAMAARRAYSMTPDRRVWKYLGWVPRYLELFRKIRCTRKVLPQLTTPTKAFLCEDDEMVSLRAERLLLSHPAVELTYLPQSTHFVYSEKDAAVLRGSLTEFFTHQYST